ncbi:MAG: hypothetical protein JXN64_01215 [Spirochaetes bacterium]|nr:hypothetical protein [Spirochaetota bacterium]
MNKKIILSVSLVSFIIILIIISSLYKLINKSTSNEEINDQQTGINYEGKYAQYSCNVVNNDKYIKSWDIGLIKRNNIIYIIDASFAIWLKKEAKYQFELEPETFLLPISKKQCELSIKSVEGNIYKLIGSFKHSGEFDEYKGKLFFQGRYIEFEKENKRLDTKLAIECLPVEL